MTEDQPEETPTRDQPEICEFRVVVMVDDHEPVAIVVPYSVDVSPRIADLLESAARGLEFLGLWSAADLTEER